MKRITDFIINKRHFILLLFITLTIVAGVLSSKVNINYDIAKYLPSTSKTRIGMDIMEEEFAGTETSTLNLMFENLADEKKLDIKSELESIDGVESVDYDDTENYNKENYTLYVITVDGKSDSQKGTDVYNEVTAKYKDYTIYTSGDVSECNKTVLPLAIIVLAVASALVILLIMCESYLEPFLFLISILMAVVLNKGTNIIFPSVSNITNSIAAILQMALSMDYSIMLMNRYDQEKQIEKDKVKAMKNALYKAFTAISSSSITTIVGLLALVFMSFTIGKDLGFVLAKGVLFSLICIFFVLPALILMFDKWIVKTKKKSPNIKLNTVGKFSYKFRFVAIPVFLIVFITSFALKGNLGINYTDVQSDEISKIFKENNQIAIVYKNEDEEKISKYLSNFEDNAKVDEVLGYGNTINEKLTYDKLNDKLNDLGSDVSIQDYLLKILYYDYYNPNDNNKMTFNDFINFIEEEAYNNEQASKKFDDKMKNDVTRLKNFVTVSSINKKRSPNNIANILQIDESKMNDILIYYLSKNYNTKLGMDEFVNFMNKDVITNKKYAVRVNSENKSKLNTLSKFVDKKKIQTKMQSEQIATLFGIDSKIINELYQYYAIINNTDMKLTISEFSTFVLDEVINNSNYSSSFDAETIQNIKLLSTFSNLNIINKEMNSKELSSFFGIDEMKISLLLLLKYNNETTNTSELTATPNKLVNVILDNKDLDIIKTYVDEATMKELQLLSAVMTSTINNKSFTYEELSQIIGMDKDSVNKIYTLYVSMKINTTITPKEFVDFVLAHKNDSMLENKISNSTIKDLNLLQSVMDGIINNKKYNSNELTSLLGINKDDANLLYGLYNFKYINKNPNISLKEFINFLLKNVVTNKEYSNNFDENQILKLNTVNRIMSAATNNTKYTADEIFAIISKLSNSVEKSTIDMLYTYYGSSKQYNNDWEMTVEEFVNFLNQNILQDERFSDFIEDKMRNDITEAKTTIKDAKELLLGDKYSRIILNTKFDMESSETFDFTQNIQNTLGKDLDEFYVIGDSPMAYEMSKSFDNELNLMTIITMIAIFIVVAITFKSLLIPTILVLTIQTAVYLTMGILSIVGENVYFISILIVQSILMGATIDYAILYTTYYLEHRKSESIKESIIKSYNNSIHTILTSSSILILVTLIIASFTSAIASKICKTISEGTLCSTILILTLLPAVLACCDKFITKNSWFANLFNKK